MAHIYTRGRLEEFENEDGGWLAARVGLMPYKSWSKLPWLVRHIHTPVDPTVSSSLHVAPGGGGEGERGAMVFALGKRVYDTTAEWRGSV